MNVAALKRWHWIVIALLVGGVCGGVRQSTGAQIEDELDRHGKLIADPARFEAALLRKVHAQPLLKDVTVYPYRIDRQRGGRQLVHIVAGKYWDGTPVKENGRMVAKWVPACFLARVPFEPRQPLPGANAGRAARFETVVEYLESLARTDGVRYRYAWWWWAREPLFTWTTGSFVLIGLVWPTFVNLVAFGTLVRPPEAKGISLWNVRSRGRADGPPAAARSASLDAIEREMEGVVAGDPPAAPAPAAGARPPRALSSVPLHAVDAGPQEAKDFRADEDDFYPTAVSVDRTKPN